MQKAINHIAVACHDAGITDVIICPGSRNAPLTMAFVRSGLFTCASVIDERSAGFIGLGIALRTSKPVAVICTSGSAVVNLYPALVEAFYQRIPLVMITADRPPELIDQWDGQTIRQENIFGQHVKGSFQTPDQYDDIFLFYKTCTDAVLSAEEGIKGPVHINVPLREPLYPESQVPFETVTASFPENWPAVFPFSTKINITGKKKILLLFGMSTKKDYITTKKLVIINDLMSNFIVSNTADEKVLMIQDKQLLEELKPDVLITAGTFMLSKPLKSYLRKYKPAQHYHFSPEGDCADPFGTSPVVMRDEISSYLEELEDLTDENYFNQWMAASSAVRSAHKQAMASTVWQEFSVVQRVMEHLPANSVFHLGNSMPVRYAAFCERNDRISEIFCNRGTSGIDGCVSTAVGFSSKDKNWNTLLVGDVAFLYDSNAFWNKLNKSNLRVVVLNNAGGGIFRLIDGPSAQPELEEFFETIHTRTAEFLCKNLDVAYYRADNYRDLSEVLEHFWDESGKAAVLEMFTDRTDNQTFFKHYKSQLNGVKISLGND